jgi:mannose-6-phosphate isomerase
MSVVTNGAHTGATLHELVGKLGEALLGSAVPRGPFPLLIKIIDANRRLSVQVHPDNESAPAVGGEAKTEMWYVLDAAAGAVVFAGLKPGTGLGEFDAALASQRLEDVLNPVPVAPGDAVYVPGGRVHAIAEGCLLLEVQQNSNTTYRVYDWGRVDKDGNPRELHIDQERKVIRWEEKEPVKATAEELGSDEAGATRRILRCPFFEVIRFDVAGRRTVRNSGRSFHALFTVAGEVTVETPDSTVQMPAGTSCLIPAALPAYTLAPGSAEAAVICSSAC